MPDERECTYIHLQYEHKIACYALFFTAPISYFETSKTMLNPTQNHRSIGKCSHDTRLYSPTHIVSTIKDRSPYVCFYFIKRNFIYIILESHQRYRNRQYQNLATKYTNNSLTTPKKTVKKTEDEVIFMVYSMPKRP